MSAAAEAESLDELFLRLEAAGVMLRIDPGLMPTMAKAPTLGRWELDLLRTVEDVVRLGHVDHVTEDECVLAGGVVPLGAGSLVVHCAASGPSLPPAGSVVAAGQDPAPDGQRRVPVLRGGAGRVRRGDPRRRPRTEPAVPAQRLRRHPGQLGADAGAGSTGVPGLQRRVRHRCLVQPVRLEPDPDRPSQRELPAVHEAAVRAAAATDRGLARMSALADG